MTSVLWRDFRNYFGNPGFITIIIVAALYGFVGQAFDLIHDGVPAIGYADDIIIALSLYLIIRYWVVIGILRLFGKYTKVFGTKGGKGDE